MLLELESATDGHDDSRVGATHPLLIKVGAQRFQFGFVRAKRSQCADETWNQHLLNENGTPLSPRAPREVEQANRKLGHDAVESERRRNGQEGRHDA